jgi:ribosomal protein S18 acetylase RimI-like enzyme
MKIRIRRSNKEDVDGIYDCHLKCFEQGDHWYKSTIKQFVDNSFVVEEVDTKNIVGVLLQGPIIPCEQSEIENFIPCTTEGELFVENNLHLKTNYGITMICVIPECRSKGIATKLIELHIKENSNKNLCLNSRQSNKSIKLYEKLGYKHIVTVKNKYYFPTEDSFFMIKNIS